MAKIKFDYTEMKRLIRAECGTYQNFASAMDMSYITLYGRLNGRSEFKSSEILRAERILRVKAPDVNKIFFTPKVADVQRKADQRFPCHKVAQMQQ